MSIFNLLLRKDYRLKKKISFFFDFVSIFSSTIFTMKDSSKSNRSKYSFKKTVQKMIYFVDLQNQTKVLYHLLSKNVFSERSSLSREKMQNISMNNQKTKNKSSSTDDRTSHQLFSSKSFTILSLLQIIFQTIIFSVISSSILRTVSSKSTQFMIAWMTSNMYEITTFNKKIESEVYWFLPKVYIWFFKKINFHDFSLANSILNDY